MVLDIALNWDQMTYRATSLDGDSKFLLIAIRDNRRREVNFWIRHKHRKGWMLVKSGRDTISNSLKWYALKHKGES